MRIKWLPLHYLKAPSEIPSLLTSSSHPNSMLIVFSHIPKPLKDVFYSEKSLDKGDVWVPINPVHPKFLPRVLGKGLTSWFSTPPPTWPGVWVQTPWAGAS